MNTQVSAFLSRRLVDRRGRHRSRVLKRQKFLNGKDHASPEEQSTRRLIELAALLRHAKKNVPRFRALLPVPEDIRPENAEMVLSRLPVMTREEIQEEPEAFLAESVIPMKRDSTGGSTGQPMTFMVDRRTQISREASLMWANSLAGWQHGDRIAMLWGADRDVRSASANLRLWLRWRVENRRWFNAFDMGDSEMSAFYRQMRRFKPHIIVAYAGAMDTFAQFVKQRGWQPEFPMKAIVCSAEVVTERMRNVIESVFPAKVYDRYGSREFGAIAAECGAHDGLHVNQDDCYLEIQSPAPSTVPGEILVTYLRNYAMPFIRYNTRDLAYNSGAGPCACGRHGLRISAVLGRQSDMIRTDKGNLIHGEFFTHVFYGAPSVTDFRFVQESPNSYVLQLVGDQREISKQWPQWEQTIREAIGSHAILKMELMGSLPVLPSGKRRFTISHVK